MLSAKELVSHLLPLIRGLITLIRFTPYPLAILGGRTLGLLGWALDPFHRRSANTQMHAALGTAWHPLMSLKVFMNQGDILVDTIKYAYMDTQELRRRVRIEGREHLEQALASGRGIMLVAGHIGNWEILANLARLIDIEFCVMADQRDDPGLESIIDGLRERTGATILPPKGKALMLVRELRRGRTIGMVVDQRGRRGERLLCDVFGLPAPTNPAPAVIALKGRALIVPVTAVREHHGYRIRIEEPLDATSFGSSAQAIQEASDFMQSWVSREVERHPDQWFWLHCRWTRRSEMRRLLREGIDFRDYILKQAEAVRQGRYL